MLANAKLPKRLADRLDLLREDEEVRERFERSVYDANRERMGRRPAPPPKPPPPELTPRQKLRQAAQGFGGVVARATAAAHAAAAAAPAADPGVESSVTAPPPAAAAQSTRPGRAARSSSPLQPHVARTPRELRDASGRRISVAAGGTSRGKKKKDTGMPSSPRRGSATAAAASASTSSSRAESPSAPAAAPAPEDPILPMPPLELPIAPLPPSSLAPWAIDLIEKSRGHRARDPLEVGGGHEANLVRRRYKGLELGGGVFRTGISSFSDAERMAELARVQAMAGPLEGPPAEAPKGAARLEAASWIGGEFLTYGKIEDSRIADTALLDSHRAPYIDPAKRPDGRQRDRGNELASLSYRPRELRDLSPRAVSEQAWKGIRPPRGAYVDDDERADAREIDYIEMVTARSLISTSLASARRQRGRF